MEYGDILYLAVGKSMFFDDEGLKRKGRIYGFGIIELWENCILNNIIKNAIHL